ncbi:alanine dehydrogenase [Abditibacteriota bacterium]|nr:alanine dehydrogenase [Abditibacteriota bacterium]
MIIGVPHEIKAFENRVALTPAGAEILVDEGHEVLVESGAGEGSGFIDAAYLNAGARIVSSVDEVWTSAELILKVKELLTEEWPRVRAGQTLFSYFHFAADEELTRAAQKSGATVIAYETVQETNRSLPLLIPMSEVAGRMAVQEAAKYLEKTFGGRGVLLSGVPGTPRANVMILGAGIAGTNAARLAAGLGADVYLFDINLDRLRHLSEVMPPNVATLYSQPQAIRDHLALADVVIGSVLLPGKKAPKLVRRDDLRRMQAGAVMVDIAIDQGGCFETSRPTTHDHPTYVEEGIIHYCVTNMPGAVPRTSTMALTNATLPYVRRLADHGWREACRSDAALAKGLNIVAGQIVHNGVAEAFGETAKDWNDLT